MDDQEGRPNERDAQLPLAPVCFGIKHSAWKFCAGKFCAWKFGKVGGWTMTRIGLAEAASFRT